jgi:hypothetical protein
MLNTDRAGYLGAVAKAARLSAERSNWRAMLPQTKSHSS